MNTAAATPTPARSSQEIELAARKILPGGWAVEKERPIATLLGSCVAVCLYDPIAKIGGMNHFMLPSGKPSGNGEQDALLRGDYAMEVLVNALLDQGAQKRRIVAKAFGGGRVITSIRTAIGENNIRFTREWLEREKFPLLSHDFGGTWPRKVLFEPDSGTAWCKRVLNGTAMSGEAARSESDYAATMERPETGIVKRVELF